MLAQRVSDLREIHIGTLDMGGIGQRHDRCLVLGRQEPPYGEYCTNPRTQLAEHVIAPRFHQLVMSGRGPIDGGRLVR
jgi:hypothetical protein